MDARPAASQPLPDVGWRGARGRRSAGAAAGAGQHGRDARALERRSRRSHSGQGADRRRLAPRGGRARGTRDAGRRRPRPQPASAVRLARAGGGASRRGAHGAAPAQLQAVLRDRDRLPGRCPVLSLSRNRHVAGRAAALPRLATRGDRLRGRAQTPAAPYVRAHRPVRRGQRCDPAPADRARPTGCPNDGADELHPGLRLRGELVRRQR